MTRCSITSGSAPSSITRLISDTRIPVDRRLVYGFGLLAGLRSGEIGALRWRHYDAAAEPLGRLQVALAYSSKRDIVKGTKTGSSKTIPVHPTLAAMRGMDPDPARRWSSMDALLERLVRAQRRPGHALEITSGALAAAVVLIVALRGKEPPAITCDSSARDVAAVWSPAIEVEMRATGS